MPCLNDVQKWQKQFCIIQTWKDDSLEENLKWHRDVNKISKERLNDYKEGFKQGYREAICTLKMHNLIKY